MGMDIHHGQSSVPPLPLPLPVRSHVLQMVRVPFWGALVLASRCPS